MSFLDLCGAAEITDAGVEAIVGGCGGSLERLSLTWASRLTDRALAALSKCERLVSTLHLR